MRHPDGAWHARSTHFPLAIAQQGSTVSGSSISHGRVLTKLPPVKSNRGKCIRLEKDDVGRVSKKPTTLWVRIPPYRPPRNLWRQAIHAEAGHLPRTSKSCMTAPNGHAVVSGKCTTQSPEEVVDGLPAFQVFDQVLERHTRAHEDRRSSHELRVGVDDALHACRCRRRGPVVAHTHAHCSRSWMKGSFWRISSALRSISSCGNTIQRSVLRR